jgi:hypothetical protein
MQMSVDGGGLGRLDPSSREPPIIFIPKSIVIKLKGGDGIFTVFDSVGNMLSCLSEYDCSSLVSYNTYIGTHHGMGVSAHTLLTHLLPTANPSNPIHNRVLYPSNVFWTKWENESKRSPGDENAQLTINNVGGKYIPIVTGGVWLSLLANKPSSKRVYIEDIIDTMAAATSFSRTVNNHPDLIEQWVGNILTTNASHGD